MLIGLGILLLVMWALGFVVFNVASAAIHLLVIAAVVALGVHLYRSYNARSGAHHGTA